MFARKNRAFYNLLNCRPKISAMSGTVTIPTPYEFPGVPKMPKIPEMITNIQNSNVARKNKFLGFVDNTEGIEDFIDEIKGNSSTVMTLDFVNFILATYLIDEDISFCKYVVGIDQSVLKGFGASISESNCGMNMLMENVNNHAQKMYDLICECDNSRADHRLIKSFCRQYSIVLGNSCTCNNKNVQHNSSNLRHYASVLFGIHIEFFDNDGKILMENVDMTKVAKFKEQIESNLLENYATSNQIEEALIIMCLKGIDEYSENMIVEIMDSIMNRDLAKALRDCSD